MKFKLTTMTSLFLIFETFYFSTDSTSICSSTISSSEEEPDINEKKSIFNNSFNVLPGPSSPDHHIKYLSLPNIRIYMSQNIQKIIVLRLPSAAKYAACCVKFERTDALRSFHWQISIGVKNIFLRLLLLWVALKLHASCTTKQDMRPLSSHLLPDLWSNMKFTMGITKERPVCRLLCN